MLVDERNEDISHREGGEQEVGMFALYTNSSSQNNEWKEEKCSRDLRKVIIQMRKDALLPFVTFKHN